MQELSLIGDIIKSKRLSLNLRMDDVARKCDITRSTLWSIEKGNSNCSLNTIIKILGFLGLSLSLSDSTNNKIKRNRATRKNTVLDKKINRFIVMCIEQYAAYCKESGKNIYKVMKEKGIINELITDYEDLHGMSTEWLNNYFDRLR